MTTLEVGTHIRLPNTSEWVVLRGSLPAESGLQVFVAHDDGSVSEHNIADFGGVERLTEDGSAVLAAASRRMALIATLLGRR